MGCLSNSSALHWKRFGDFAGFFDVALSSHLLGAIKPDLDCLAKVVDRCGVPAGDAIFFDDSPTNVEAAGRAGLRAFHVLGIDGLERVLVQQGLLR